MGPHEALAAELKGLEELLLVPDVRKSTRLTELLADEFVEFGSSAVRAVSTPKTTLWWCSRRNRPSYRRHRTSKLLPWHQTLRS